MDDERQRATEKFVIQSTIKKFILDALFICDIERDKIPFDLKQPFNTVVDKIVSLLIENHILKLEGKLPQIKEKLSITKETLENLHEKIMVQILQGFKGLGVAALEESGVLDELDTIISEIIKREKKHRDEEKSCKEKLK